MLLKVYECILLIVALSCILTLFCHFNCFFCAFRLTKEKSMYEKESVQIASKIEDMKAQGKDEYDIKKQVRIST